MNRKGFIPGCRPDHVIPAGLLKADRADAPSAGPSDYGSRLPPDAPEEAARSRITASSGVTNSVL